ncbi:LacI family DNA-binding transcriptional regulator [Fundicoccus culcitae]|uniref:LacI family DNA-binding transcriptional regulator n=1 Tax=Fundicoccus culcitae TaxID=2969821 RepID=A0ABY5P5A3_9LACT|nr:LacI family DNA-binding transcriptional regulator [Fundicoccus culcitae]UUX33926.1 LacI family DNA-binding transcriptional regulator [Fundicoccus culcitae]
MAVTIKDVARKAGVAPSTVTRVIHDSPIISQKTKEKVREVMKEMNYYPNLNARSLASKKTSVIGLVFPDATDAFYQNPFFPTVMRGLNEAGAKSKYSLLLTTGNDLESRFSSVQRMVHGRQVDGLIFLYARQNDPILEFVHQQHFPMVVIGQPSIENIPFVNNRNQQMAKDATNYLLDKGAIKIGFIGGDPEQQFINDRLKGFKEALEDKHITYDDSWVFNDLSFLPEVGYDLAQYIAREQSFDAFVVADQYVATGFKEGWKSVSDSVVPVITFHAFQSNESPFLRMDPYVNINAHELGKGALDMLLEVIEAEDKSEEHVFQKYVDHEIVEL